MEQGLFFFPDAIEPARVIGRKRPKMLSQLARNTPKPKKATRRPV